MTNRVKILLSILAMSAVVFVSGWIVVSVSNVPVVLFKPACKTADGEYVRLEGRVTYEFMDALLDVHRAYSFPTDRKASVGKECNTKMTRSMDLEFTTGLMAGVMKDTGTKESNTE